MGHAGIHGVMGQVGDHGVRGQSGGHVARGQGADRGARGECGRQGVSGSWARQGVTGSGGTGHGVMGQPGGHGVNMADRGSLGHGGSWGRGEVKTSTYTPALPSPKTVPEGRMTHQLGIFHAGPLIR